jgi:hypothetical protein
MSSIAIRNGMSHVAVGVLAGALIEAVMPAFSGEGSDVTSQVLELAVQSALNGLAVVASSNLIDVDNDSTHGIPFSLGLLYSQESLRLRIASVSTLIQAQLPRLALKIRARASAVQTSIQA